MNYHKLFYSYTVGTINNDGDKKPNQKIDFNTLEQAQEFIANKSNYNMILGRIKSGYCVIDCDDDKSVIAFDKLINYLNLTPVIIQTTRGKHYYFKLKNSSNYKAWNGVVNAYGVKYDIKPGNRKPIDTNNGKVQGTNLGCIYQDNKLRQVLSDPEEISTLPKALICKLQIGKENVIPAYDIEDRNDALFTQYRCAYIKNKFSQQDAIDFVTTMQEAGILNGGDKPNLSDDEIKTIMREPWQISSSPTKKGGSFWNENVFLYDEFAKWLIEENHIIRVNGHLAIYHDNVYTFNHKRIIEAIRKADTKLTKSRVNEVMDRLQVCTYLTQTKDDETDWITFNNCNVNVRTLETEEHSPDRVTFNKIACNYNPEANDQRLHDFISSLVNKNAKKALQLFEICGLSMYRCARRWRTGQIVMLVGDKGCGKSSYLELLYALLGDNASTLSLEDLNKTFRTANLLGKTANIGDDIEDNYIKDTAIMKKLATGQPMMVENKGEDPFTLNSYATLIFSANEVPIIKDPKGAVNSRMLYIPFEADFTKNGDPEFVQKLICQEVLETLAYRAMVALNYVLKNGQIDLLDCNKKLSKEFDTANNNLRAYLADKELTQKYICGKVCDDIYKDYEDWCFVKDLQPKSVNVFSKFLCKKFGLVKKRGPANHLYSGVRKYIYIVAS